MDSQILLMILLLILLEITTSTDFTTKYSRICLKTYPKKYIPFLLLWGKDRGLGAKWLRKK